VEPRNELRPLFLPGQGIARCSAQWCFWEIGDGSDFCHDRDTRCRHPFPSTAVDTEMSGDPSQAGIPRPHHVAFGNSRIQEMSIDQSDAAAVKVPLVNEGEDFFMGGLAGPRQSVE